MVGLKDSVSADDEKSTRQNHMLGALRGFNLAMAFLCGISVLKESAHFRAQVILAEAIMFGAVTVDALRVGGGLNYLVPALHALVAAAGFVINSMEPGIFTKDKNA